MITTKPANSRGDTTICHRTDKQDEWSGRWLFCGLKSVCQIVSSASLWLPSCSPTRVSSGVCPNNWLVDDIRVRWLNWLTICCLMSCKIYVDSTMYRAFLILSFMVLFPALLRHLISQEAIFHLRVIVRDHFCRWYERVCRKMAFMNFSLLFIRMLVNFRRGAYE